MLYTLSEKIEYMNSDFKRSRLYSMQMPDDVNLIPSFLRQALDAGMEWFSRYHGRGHIEKIAFYMMHDYLDSLVKDAESKV